jgi:hypothetical protein
VASLEAAAVASFLADLYDQVFNKRQQISLPCAHEHLMQNLEYDWTVWDMPLETMQDNQRDDAKETKLPRLLMKDKKVLSRWHTLCPYTCYQGQGDSTRKLSFHKQSCIQLTLEQMTYQ